MIRTAGSQNTSNSDTFLIAASMAKFQIGVDVCISGLTVMYSTSSVTGSCIKSPVWQILLDDRISDFEWGYGVWQSRDKR